VIDEKLFRRAGRIESELRAEGVPAMLIPGILGAAFMASLTNLPLAERVMAIRIHITALRTIYDDVMGAQQAPDGPMPDP
jgi:precorrin-2 methylase